MLVNWTDWSSDLFGKSMAGYETAMGVFAWVLIFSGIIAYVYVKQQSYVAAASAGIVILTAFASTGYIIGADSWILLITIIICLAITGLFVLFISKRRN